MTEKGHNVSTQRGARIIAYGYGDDVKHFAKVATWDANGYPASILSKWGGAEVIKSTSADPFISVYGSPVQFYS